MVVIALIRGKVMGYLFLHFAPSLVHLMQSHVIPLGKEVAYVVGRTVVVDGRFFVDEVVDCFSVAEDDHVGGTDCQGIDLSIRA